MDSATIRWNTNPAMSNGAVIAPNDPGNQNLALGPIGPVLHSIIGPGPCANMVLFLQFQRTFTMLLLPLNATDPAVTGHCEFGMRFHRRIRRFVAVRTQVTYSDLQPSRMHRATTKATD